MREQLELKVGLFILISLGAIGYMFFTLSPEIFSTIKYAKYYTIADDAGGIVEKTHVKSNGVVIGKVTEISLKENGTRIEFEIKSNIKIPIGSTISIKEKGLLGDVFVNLTRSSNKGHYHKPKSLLSFEKIFKMGDIFAKAGDISGNINDITISLNSTIKDLSKIIRQNGSNLTNTITNVSNISAKLKQILDNKKFEKTFDNFYTISSDLKKSISKINKLINKGKLAENLQETLASANKSLKNIELITEKINKGEGTLGKIIKDDKLIVELETVAKETRKLLSKTKNIKFSVDYHGELSSKSTQHFFNLKLQHRPDKYYLLGVSDKYFRVKEKKVKTINTEWGDNVIQETVREKPSLVFNAQYAKRWGNLQMRFGVFESTGGLASDIFAFRDRLRISFEAYNWNDNKNISKRAFIKSYASFLFFNHIYLIGGVLDATNSLNEKARVFGGLGLDFSEDLLNTAPSFLSFAF